MSLKVWLPLDGDLRNLGCSDIEVTNNGATIDDNGKIGKCYSLNGTSNYITGTYQITTNISFCCWANFSSQPTGNFLCDARSETGVGYQPIYVTAHRIQIGGSGSSFPEITYNWVANTWYHICVTHDSTSGKLYVNGQLIATTSAKGFEGGECNFTLGCRYSKTGYCAAKINDFRIYDHCLSAAEVHEISMGLIVHYKLDDANPNPNLLPDSDAPSLTKVYGNYNRYWEGAGGTNYTNTFEPIEDPPAPGLQYMVRHTRTSEANFHSMVWYSGGTIALTIGNTYTMSCYAKVVSGTNLRICFEIGSGTYANTNVTLTNDNEWHQYSWTFTPTSDTAPDGLTRIYCGGLRSVGTVLLCGYKLEEGDTATPWIPYESEPLHKVLYHTQIEDSSGYNHFATTPSVLAATSNTPRYDKTIFLNGTTASSTDDIFQSNVLIPELTWSAWIKREYTDVTDRVIYNGIFKIRLTDYNNINFRPYITWLHYTSNNTGSSNSWIPPNDAMPYDTWIHLALTFKDGILKQYTNGELIGTSDRTSTGQFIKAKTGHYLFALDETSQFWIGGISDMRIYATALLDNDIKLLYNMGMRVDNSQNLHTFEMEELSKNYVEIGENWLNKSGTTNGINWTFNSDGSMTLNGTNTNSSNFILIWNFYDSTITSSYNGNDSIKHIPNGIYTMYTGHPKIDIQLIGSNVTGNTYTWIQSGNSTTTTVTIDDTYKYNWIRLLIRPNVTFNNFTFYPTILLNGNISLNKNSFKGNFRENQKASFYKNKITEANEFLEI